jgi:predicted PurR-regulated permease PerM
MWNILNTIFDLLLLLIAAYIFAATFEPLRTRVFKRPLSRRAVLAMRIVAAVCAVSLLVVVVTDILRYAQ